MNFSGEADLEIAPRRTEEQSAQGRRGGGALAIIFKAVACAVACMPVAADAASALYTCKNAQGKKIYVSERELCASDVQQRGAASSPASAPAPASPAAPAPVVAPAADSPHGRILQILDYELRHETARKQDVERVIAAGASPALLSALQRQREEHDRNIAAILREIARLNAP